MNNSLPTRSRKPGDNWRRDKDQDERRKPLDSRKIYTANGVSNDVSVVDVKTRKELHRIKIGDGPWGIAIVSKKVIA